VVVLVVKISLPPPRHVWSRGSGCPLCVRWWTLGLAQCPYQQSRAKVARQMSLSSDELLKVPLRSDRGVKHRGE
jgi:hypothetical protein